MLKLKQFVTANFCLQCQGCCRFSECDTIWQPHLLKQEEEKLTKKVSLKSNAGLGFICVSLDTGNNKCKIYSQRPLECQLYPFLINQEINKVFLAVDLKCPYAKEKLKSKEFKAYLHYLISQFKTLAYRDILKNNPQIIQRYIGILNLKALKI